MARPTKPKSLHIAEGTHRPDRHGAVDDPTDVIATGSPTSPEELDEEGTWFWNTVLASMPPTVLAQADSMALYGAARWWSIWRNCDRKVSESGDNLEAAYKWGIMAGMSWKHCNGLLREFGLTPSARNSLKLQPQGKKTDSLGAFLGEGA